MLLLVLTGSPNESRLLSGNLCLDYTDREQSLSWLIGTWSELWYGTSLFYWFRGTARSCWTSFMSPMTVTRTGPRVDCPGSLTPWPYLPVPRPWRRGCSYPSSFSCRSQSPGLATSQFTPAHISTCCPQSDTLICQLASSFPLKAPKYLLLWRYIRLYQHRARACQRGDGPMVPSLQRPPSSSLQNSRSLPQWTKLAEPAHHGASE